MSVLDERTPPDGRSGHGALATGPADAGRGARGAGGDFEVEADTIPAGVRCRGCGRRHLPERIPVLQVRPVASGEGLPSGTVVMDLVCVRCRRPGVLIAPDPSAMPAEEAAVVDALRGPPTRAARTDLGVVDGGRRNLPWPTGPEQR